MKQKFNAWPVLGTVFEYIKCEANGSTPLKQQRILFSHLDSPKFVDSTRMKQKFIAWPARHSVRLKCKANGSTPLKFQWLKDGQAKIQRRLQPRIRTDTWYLKLKDLAPLDSGKYTCLVSNTYGSINHTFTLRIVGESSICCLLKRAGTTVLHE